jgi:hypothetical protein
MDGKISGKTCFLLLIQELLAHAFIGLKRLIDIKNRFRTGETDQTGEHGHQTPEKRLENA